MAFQTYNRKTRAWVLYRNGKIADVKQQNPKQPFKGVPKKGFKRKKGTKYLK